MYRVLLITEEPVLAAGMTAVLASAASIAPDIQIVGPSSNVTGLVQERDPDVLLLDFLPQDYPLLLELRHDIPSCKIVLWMRSVPIEIACQAMRLGVRGILRKTLAVDLLLKCLEVVTAGEFWFDRELTAGFLESRTVELTPRESQIVPLVAQGLKNKEIAHELNVAEATIRIYLSTLFRKLGVKDRYELAIYGVKNMLPDRRPRGKEETSCEHSARSRLRFLVLEKPPVEPADCLRRENMTPTFRREMGRARPARNGR